MTSRTSDSPQRTALASVAAAAALVAIKLVAGLLEIRVAHPDVIDVSVHTDHD